MQTVAISHSTQNVFTALGYPNPLDAARQQARMILLGRLARYESRIQQMEARWGSLENLRMQYTARGREDFAVDDDYLQWQWYADAIELIKGQLEIIVNPENAPSI